MSCKVVCFLAEIGVNAMLDTGVRYHGTNGLPPENGDMAIKFVFCKPMPVKRGMERPMLYMGLECRTLHPICWLLGRA